MDNPEQSKWLTARDALIAAHEANAAFSGLLLAALLAIVFAIGSTIGESGTARIVQAKPLFVRHEQAVWLCKPLTPTGGE